MNEELKIIISAEIDKLKTELNKGKKEVEDFSKKSKVSFSEFNDGVQKAGDVSKKALATAGAAIAGAATALLALSSSTKEYREAQAKLTTAFESAGASAETAKSTYNDLYRVLGDDGQAVEAANHLAKLTTNQKELNQWTTICQGVYATFGDSLPIEGLTEAANETAKVGTVTGGLADALNWAGISEDAFNEKLAACNNEAQREKLIRETLSGVYDDAAKKYEKNAADVIAQNEAQGKLNDSMATLGETLAPINAALTEFASAFLEKITPALQEFMDNHGTALAEALEGIAEAIGKVINWIADNWELVSTLAAIITGIAVALSIFSTVMAIVNAVMMASPVTWIVLAIVAAVAALVAIIVVCIKYWDEIKAAVLTAVTAIGEWISGLWESIVGGLQAAWDWITGLLSTIGTWIYDNVIAPVVGFFVGLWEKIVETFNAVIMPWIEIIKRASTLIYEKVIKPIIDYFVGLWNKIKEVFSVVGSWFNEKVIQPVVNFFSGMWNGLKEGASKAWEGVKSVFSKVTSFFGDIFGKAWEKVKNVFSAGGKIFAGIKEGITSVFKKVVNSIIRGINKVVSIPFKAINTALSKIRDINILGVQPFTWIKTFTVPQIPELEKGGVLKRGQIGLLEGNGTEAVVPLEKNTEWLDRIAERLNANTASIKAPIVLNVDGKRFAEISVDSINQLTKQKGSLPLVLA